MRYLSNSAILAAAAALVACASQGPTTTTETGAALAGAPPAAAAPPAATLAATSGAAGAPVAGAAAAAAPAAAAADSASKDTFKIPGGYRHVVVNGEDRYCHSEYAVGSRAQKVTECLTLAQLEKREEDKRNFIEAVQKAGGTSAHNYIPGGAGAMP